MHAFGLKTGCPTISTEKGNIIKSKNLPFAGSPRVVHVLLPITAPFSPNALAFKQQQMGAETRPFLKRHFLNVPWLHVFTLSTSSNSKNP